MTVQGPDQPVGPLQQHAADQPAAQSIPAAQAAIAAAAAAQVAPLPTPAALDQPDWAALRCDYIARVKRDPFSLQDIAKELESRHVE